ncbi:MAG TPA: ABC transporter permease subunit [Dongiaceae bacterium]|jgi:His/Glu/Gln/Arg/opine family amino acid ABC transporter permease subunit|nr:ABC transporter permease subunit [Dongiaceae bacterium]
MNPGKSVWDLLAYGDQGWSDELLAGLWLTLQISVCTYIVGFGFGLLGAGMKLSGNRILFRIGDAYTTIMRALPELLLLLLLYYSGTTTLKDILVALDLASEEFQINTFAAAVMALGFILGAYMTEVLRGAIQSVPKGQIEAARAYGMHFGLRFRRVLFPQMMRYATPGMGNLWLNTTKDSSLIVVLGSVPELLSASRGAAAATKHYAFFYGVCGLLFLLITVTSMIIQARIEKRLGRGYRRV